MTPKFQKGTLVEIVQAKLRPDLIGMRFHITEYCLEDIVLYETPFKSTGVNSEYVWAGEDTLREVDIDEGFEFIDDWHAWYPTITKVEISYA